MGAVRTAGFVVRLTVAAPEMCRRIEADPSPRPRLTDAPDLLTECERLLSKREAQYAGAARGSVATDGRTPDEVAEQVLRVFQARSNRP
jgi:shikimate kinase